MNVAKWVPLALLMLPFLELAAFILVAAIIGFGWALSLLLAGSFAGLLILRHAGGNHIARMRVAVDQGSFTTLRADGAGGMLLFVGILLLIPGFISDHLALFLLAAQLWRAAGAALGTRMGTARDGGVVDLTPEQWHQVPDPSLPDRRGDEQKH
jgi:UPF0716 protein FxsA